MSGVPKGGSSRWPLLVIGGVLLVALASAGIIQLLGGGDDHTAASSGRPDPNSLSADQVLVVAGMPPSTGVVTKDDLDHAIEQQAAQAKLKAVPSTTEAKYAELEKAALGELTDEIWIRGQADEMGIVVSPAEVAGELAAIKKKNFETDASYEDFMRTSHFTPEDVEERVVLQLLSTKIQEAISDDAPTPATTGVGAQQSTKLRQTAEQEAFTDFVHEYQSRWRSRTVCAPAYVFERCSNGKSEGAAATGNAIAAP
jgi:SurA N-terminal domain